MCLSPRHYLRVGSGFRQMVAGLRQGAGCLSLASSEFDLPGDVGPCVAFNYSDTSFWCNSLFGTRPLPASPSDVRVVKLVCKPFAHGPPGLRRPLRHARTNLYLTAKGASAESSVSAHEARTDVVSIVLGLEDVGHSSSSSLTAEIRFPCKMWLTLVL